MKLECVRSFIEVVKYKSFSLAAKQLYLSQPTITTHIKQLEAELNVQLVIRSTKDVLLTEEGSIFYPYALQLIETESLAIEHLRKKGNRVGGVVSVAVSAVLGSDRFWDFLAQYRKNNPDISFQTSVCGAAEIVRKILDYEVQIGIGGAECVGDTIDAELLFEDELILITPNNETYRAMNGVFPLNELKNEWYINHKPGRTARDMVKFAGEILKLTPSSFKVAAQFETIEMVKKAVEDGAGIAFTSKYAVEDLLKEQKVIGFSFPGFPTKRRFYLMRHKKRELLPEVSSVMEDLREYYSKK